MNLNPIRQCDLIVSNWDRLIVSVDYVSKSKSSKMTAEYNN